MVMVGPSHPEHVVNPNGSKSEYDLTACYAPRCSTIESDLLYYSMWMRSLRSMWMRSLDELLNGSPALPTPVTTRFLGLDRSRAAPLLVKKCQGPTSATEWPTHDL
jgi:hypothetical protein